MLDYAYSLDAGGNILGKNTEHGAYQYGYDALNRLIEVDNPTLEDEAYTYDGAGNRLTDAKVEGGWEYAFGNQLTAYGAASLTYDANGSLVTKAESGVVEEYLYNLENRLVEVRDGAAASIGKYGYDPFGRRLWKEVGGVRTYFLYAEEGLVAEMDSGGAITRQYGWRPGRTWGTDPVYLSAGGSTYFYQNDHLGTPHRLVGVNGTVVWAATYEALGMAFSDLQQIKNPLRFPGQYYDSETGKHYNYFRDYEPVTGRYIQSDPIGLDGGINTYSYAYSNPVVNVDPLGLRPPCGPGLKRAPAPGNEKNYPQVYICVPDPTDSTDPNDPRHRWCPSGDCAVYPQDSHRECYEVDYDTFDKCMEVSDPQCTDGDTMACIAGDKSACARCDVGYEVMRMAACYAMSTNKREGCCEK